MYQAIIIDDEKWVIKSLIATISGQNYFEIVGEFYDGASAYSYIKTRKPDLAFVDVQLAGMNGLELLQLANQEKLPTLFIVISGHAEFAYAQKAMFNNAIGYCLKPFSRSELMDSMQKAYEILKNRTTPPAAPVETVSDSEDLPPLPGTEKHFVSPEKLLVENKSVRIMLEHLKKHYTEDISIQDLADLTSVTPNYASQLFKEETGYTFSSYLTSLRIHQAAVLLYTTDMPIFLVASQVGYKDYFYFAKVFKKITGYTPSTYRSALAKNQERNI
jgi:two-component system response regulator YesN